MYSPVTPIWAAIALLLAGCVSVPSGEKPGPDPSEAKLVPMFQKIDGTRYHIVRANDTLAKIAQTYGRDINDLAQWNNLKPDDTISVGQYLRVDGVSSENTPPKSTAVTIPVAPTAPPEPTPIEPPSAKGTHTVQPGESLDSIASQYGYSAKEIAAWNKIEDPSGVAAGQILTVIPPNSTHSLVEMVDYHTVLPGDNLSNLARHYDVEVSELITSNNIQTVDKELSIGQSLRVTPPVPTDSATPSPVSTLPPEISSSDEETYHTVDFGETLSGIAEKYNLRWRELATWNNIPSPYTVKVGQKLRLSNPSEPNSYHVAKPGETLQSIAKMYELSVDDLAKWNELGKPYTIYPGFKVKLAQH